MIIPINVSTLSCSSDACFPPQLARLGANNIVLIELQGSFHVEGEQDGQMAASLDISNEAKPLMRIGYHLLEGKIVNLSKPLAVMKKKSPASEIPARETEGMDIDGDNSTNGLRGTCEYDIVAVVKRKILFSKRPMPITNAASVSVLTREGGSKR